MDKAHVVTPSPWYLAHSLTEVLRPIDSFFSSEKVIRVVIGRRCLPRVLSPQANRMHNYLALLSAQLAASFPYGNIVLNSSSSWTHRRPFLQVPWLGDTKHFLANGRNGNGSPFLTWNLNVSTFTPPYMFS